MNSEGLQYMVRTVCCAKNQRKIKALNIRNELEKVIKQ